MGGEKHLYFFTNSYPYGGESFVANEVEALSKYYDKILLFPGISGELKDPLPEKVELKNLSFSTGGRAKMMISNFFLLLNIFLLDFLKNSDKKNYFRRFRYNLSVCLNTISLSEQVARIIEKDPSEKQFVSFWMDQWALCLSILKYKKKIQNFAFRVHQHDLYADGNPQYYIPFRFFNIKMTSAVFPDSKRGVKFLKDFNYFPGKIRLGHLGVADKGTNPFDGNNFVIVSCSALIERKRVGLIADVLKQIDTPVIWIHFGARGDTANSFNELKAKCETLPANIKVILRGDVSYNELIEFYRSNPVNLFITLTRAEGLPVSVIEAVSFGIPVLATDVMGLPDVVTPESGIVIDPGMPVSEIAKVIKEFKTGDKNTEAYRKKVKEFWAGNFNSELNYYNFNTNINNL